MHNIGMPAPRSSLPRLRFACAFAHASPTPQQFEMIELPRTEGLDLLDWLGLGRPEFGAIAARELAPRCRRRLWNIERNADPSRRARTLELLAFAEAAGEGMVQFG